MLRLRDSDDQFGLSYFFVLHRGAQQRDALSTLSKRMNVLILNDVSLRHCLASQQKIVTHRWITFCHALLGQALAWPMDVTILFLAS